MMFFLPSIASVRTFSEASIARAWQQEVSRLNGAKPSLEAGSRAPGAAVKPPLPEQGPASKPFLSFSAGLTDDAVLQRAPAAAAVYGLAPRGTAVTVHLIDELGASAAVVVATAEVEMGGTADPLCQSRCVTSGHCAEGQISACQKPSCAMGCILAGRTSSIAACKASCAIAADPDSGCEFTVVSPAGPWHLPEDRYQNQTLQMCSNGPILSNGTQCSSCGGPECQPGCEFGAPTGRSLLIAWKALLPPAEAGGSFTITASAGTEAVSIRRVTFGDVYFCSGQSNMDLALQYTFEKRVRIDSNWFLISTHIPPPCFPDPILPERLLCPFLLYPTRRRHGRRHTRGSLRTAGFLMWQAFTGFLLWQAFT